MSTDCLLDIAVVGKSLPEMVKSETSGDFQTLMLRLLEVCFYKTL